MRKARIILDDVVMPLLPMVLLLVLVLGDPPRWVGRYVLLPLAVLAVLYSVVRVVRAFRKGRAEGER